MLAFILNLNCRILKLVLYILKLYIEVKIVFCSSLVVLQKQKLILYHSVACQKNQIILLSNTCSPTTRTALPFCIYAH
jgi:hypothetical protein